MTIYGEKKAAMNRLMSNEKVDVLMVEERTYGDTRVSDAKKLVNTKIKRRTFQHYVDPVVHARDKFVAQLLSDCLMDTSGAPVFWTYVKKVLGDKLLLEIGSSLFRRDGGWSKVLAPYLESLAIVAVMGYCRLPEHVKQGLALYILPVWELSHIHKLMHSVAEGLSVIVRFQEKLDGADDKLEITEEGDIMKIFNVKATTIEFPACLALNHVETKSNDELELMRIESVR